MKTKEIPVVWLQAGSCSGCAVSILNSLSPKINNLLLEEVVPGVHINLRFQATIMAGQGEPVLEVLKDTMGQRHGYVFVAEGAISTKGEGAFCSLGEENDTPVDMAARFEELAANAQAVICLGTCAAFGGIPAASPNPTGCMGVGEFLKNKGISTPLINIPGCPPHPDWFINTVADIIIRGLDAVAADLDDLCRPKAFYGKLIHDNCARKPYFDKGKFAKSLNEEGCLYELGCKGPLTHADCSLRMWNSGTNWCVGANAPCIGCCEPEFPDGMSPLYQKFIADRYQIGG